MAKNSLEPKQYQLQSEPVAMDFMASNGYTLPAANHQHPPSHSVNTVASEAKPNKIQPAQVQSTVTSNQPTAPTPAADSPQLTPLPAQPIDLSLCTDMKFVMLDTYVTKLDEPYEEISGTYNWEICGERGDHCVTQIKDRFKKKRVFLIASGGLGARFVPQIHDLPQVYAIYIHCEDVAGHKRWADEFSKVRVVCNNDTFDLLPRFALDVARSHLDWGKALLEANKPVEAKAKFEAAQALFSRCARGGSSAMAAEVKAGLKECGL